jgi:hypothetical protein
MDVKFGTFHQGKNVVCGYLRREEMMRDWRRLHNEEIHNLYAAPNIIRVITPRKVRWAGHVTRTREVPNAYKSLVGKPKVKKPFGRPKRR